MNGSRRLGDLALGVAFLLLVAGGLGVAALMYGQAFRSHTDVTLLTGTVGNSLQTGSDVKLNGVPVGEVSAVATSPDGASLTLSLEPDVAAGLPAGTVARLLPKTLFGERYVQLVTDGATTGDGLADGATIHQDSSDEAVELEEVLDELLPVLQAVQPQKLAATLGELTLALRGQGAGIGESMERWGDYLTRLQPHVPQLVEDLDRLADVAEVYDVAAPDLLTALEDLTVTSRTLAEERTTLDDLYAGVLAASDETRTWLTANESTIVVLADESRAALEAVAPYADQFPCLLASVADFVPVMEEVLGVGTDEPGAHVTLSVAPDRGRYLAGRDAPTYRSGGGPRCPYTPSSRAGASAQGTGAPGAGTPGTGTPGTTATGTSSGAPTATPPPPSDLVTSLLGPDNGPQLGLARGLGDANSPGENQLIAELVAPTQGLAPAAYPGWSSLLLGPSLRGTAVVLR